VYGRELRREKEEECTRRTYFVEKDMFKLFKIF